MSSLLLPRVRCVACPRTANQTYEQPSDVGYTTVNGIDAYTGTALLSGENIFGPFEAGFDGSDAMTASIMQFKMGCSSADAASLRE